jgi:hypothetical protein
MRWLVKVAVLAASAGCLPGQPAVFQLQIPELGDRVFDSDIIEVPGPIPQTLLIRILNPVAADVDYGQIFTKLNGEGAGYITDFRNSADGKVARLDLKLREGMKLLPGTNTVEIQAINKHRRKFYRNFLIKTREDARNPYFTYEIKRAPGDNTGGPEVTVAQPDAPVVLAARERSKRISIKGKVSSVRPLAGMRVAGKEAVQPGRNVVDFDQEVTVTAGNNILVEAVDDAGNRTAVTIPVSQAGAGKPLKIEGDRYALIVGVSQYSAKPGLASLPSASLDARSLAAALTEQAGFKRENVSLLTDAEATHAQIRSAMRNFTARPAPDDLLIIFFAGYGLHDPMDPSKLYLAAHDTQLGQVGETAIAIDDLKSTLGSSIRSRQTLLLFDVNHSIEGDWATRNNNLINDYLLRLFRGDAGKAVMVGSSVSENAVEQSSGGGLFARHLIEAARGQGDANQDGVTTVREWFLQVSRAVKADSGGRQNPRFTLQQAERPVFAAAR